MVRYALVRPSRACLRFAGLLLVVTCVLVLGLLGSWYIGPDYTAHDRYDRRPLSRVTGHSTTDRLVEFHQVRGVGFNNQLQEILLLDFIARSSGRAYVYQPLSWQPRGRNAVVPLGVFTKSLTAAPSRSAAQFHEECGGDVHNVSVNLADVAQIFQNTINTLKSSEERCVQVVDWITRWGYLETSAILDLWPAFKKHVAKFQWSDFFESAFQHSTSELELDKRTIRERTLALHVRRGDFSYHCDDLARGHHPFSMWNRLSGLPDPFDAGPYNETRARERCYPSLDQMLAKVQTVLKQNPEITTVYIAHNFVWSSFAVDTYWLLRQLRRGLQELDNRKLAVVETSDLRSQLRSGEADLAVALDLELCRRAAVFIGNAFSSFSSDVTMFRLGDSLDERTIRFW